MSKQIETKPQIEYENITVKIPKGILDLLREVAPVTKTTPKEWVEYAIVEQVRAGLESDEFLPTPQDMAEQFKLNPIFKEITGTEVT